jgi:hypothetical protein
LTGANLTNTNLTSAQLGETNLTNADLTGADLTGVLDLTFGVIYDNTTCPDGQIAPTEVASCG